MTKRQTATDFAPADPTVRRGPGTIGITLDLIALALWLGGLLVIGAVVAPVAFHALRATPELASNIAAQNRIAGSIVGGALRVFNIISLVCGAYLVGGTLAAKRWGQPARICAIAAIGAIIALLITVIQEAAFFPAMDSAQAAGNMARFDTLHHTYETLADVQLACLVWFAASYAWLTGKAR